MGRNVIEEKERRAKELRDEILSRAKELHAMVQMGVVGMVPGYQRGIEEVPCDFVLLAYLCLCYVDEKGNKRYEGDYEDK